MRTRFTFADAYWFRVPMKVMVLTVAVFGLVTIWPALTDGTSHEHQRAIVGLLVVLMFIAMATTFAVAIQDSYVEIADGRLYIRFEAFFNADVPLSDIVAVRYIAPRPAWRFRFGLSTNFVDRIACSHGGRLVEIELAHAWRTRIWPRHVEVRRFWLGVREHEDLVRALDAVTRAPMAEDQRLQLPAAA
jgi:hypothetical protein